MKYPRFYPLLSVIFLTFLTPFYVLSQSFAKPHPPLKMTINSIAKKNAYGFWVNAEEEALKEATKLKKPILIDFFGIWCPPCNQLDELVFSGVAFKQAAKRFVLLKMDADSEKSWALKSKYKVGGYPTLIMAQVQDNQAGDEIDRIVGFYPTAVITAKMYEALITDGKSNQEKIMALIKKSIEKADEADDSDKVIRLAQAGIILDPENLDLKITLLKAQKQNDKDILNSTAAKKILSDIEYDRKKMPVSTLISQFELKPSQEVLNELLSRVNPSTLYIDNEGFTEADIYALGIDLKKSYTDLTIESYERLLKKYGEDSRSLNLSYTYYLQKAKNYKKAQEVFNRMIHLYPKEFTFYYPAINMALETKDFPLARSYARSSLEFSYGDNKIRSLDRSLKVAIAEVNETRSDSTFTLLRSTIDQSEEFVKKFKEPRGLQVRSGTYIKKLNQTIQEAKALLK